MKRIIDITQILGNVKTPAGVREVCATAEAHYDETGARLTVRLGTFLRNTGLVPEEKQSMLDWLPKPETICEPAGEDETIDLTREIFHRWASKVRQAVPDLAKG